MQLAHKEEYEKLVNELEVDKSSVSSVSNKQTNFYHSFVGYKMK